MKAAALNGVVHGNAHQDLEDTLNRTRPRWMGLQRRIGLTGGIASGKSTVAHWLEQQGVPVLDADVYAKEELAPGSPGAKAVIQRYGDSVRRSWSGSGLDEVDRSALGAIVFKQEAERQWLEDLIHPLVRARFEHKLVDHKDRPIVVLMIPLLFEAGLESLCSEVWLVECGDEQQLQRLMLRDGLSLTQAQERIAAQWPIAQKRPLADYILHNNGDLGSLAAQSQRLLFQDQ